ncbi:Capsule synthesis protein, CapA [Syntrophomonas zehnderi OL-4]|uniref:Capsule synthesis protein, CapA n=1 Tax=Syntrophomonas zehnderi OL-4 TaxID=690567 RepID=A0A0E4C8U7_9FIRM|nr:CapA family protein [Syntrophomonas zehnderi]CFX68802.1 Capsule synthesis protein, CapA [Syntrophomonas zehnderi OL-4]
MRKTTSVVALIALILTGSLIYYYLTQKENQSPSTVVHQPVKDKETITLLATGDILMHNTVIASGDMGESYQFDHLFAPIKSLVSQADYSIINLESALAGPETGYTGYPTFNSPDSLAQSIKEAGFDLVTTANNHILDRGLSGAMRTMDVLNQNGLDTIGTYRSQAEKDAYLIKDIRGIKIGFLAYGYDTNGIPLPQDKPYFYNLIDPDKILEDISTLRPQVDVLVLLLHWGVEYSPYPTAQQEKLAQQFLAQGVDAIIGGHPHVIQPAHIINISGQKKFVIYSMGNCIGNQRGVERNSGVVIKLAYTKDFESGKTILTGYHYTPTYSHTYNQNGRQKFRVIPIPETIAAIRAGSEPYLKTDSIPWLEQIATNCQEQMEVGPLK